MAAGPRIPMSSGSGVFTGSAMDAPVVGAQHELPLRHATGRIGHAKDEGDRRGPVVEGIEGDGPQWRLSATGRIASGNVSIAGCPGSAVRSSECVPSVSRPFHTLDLGARSAEPAQLPVLLERVEDRGIRSVSGQRSETKDQTRATQPPRSAWLLSITNSSYLCNVVSETRPLITSRARTRQIP